MFQCVVALLISLLLLISSEDCPHRNYYDSLWSFYNRSTQIIVVGRTYSELKRTPNTPVSRIFIKTFGNNELNIGQKTNTWINIEINSNELCKNRLHNNTKYIKKNKTYIWYLKASKRPQEDIAFHEASAFPDSIRNRKVVNALKKATCSGSKCDARLPNNPTVTASFKRNNLHINCKIDGGFPKAAALFIKDGRPLRKGQIRYKRNAITLRIHKRREEDSGNYTCKVFNIAGSRTRTVTVPRKKIQHITRPTAIATVTTEMASISSISPSGLSPNAKVEHCKIQSFCLNGGVCFNIPSLHMQFCRCKAEYVGYRCQFPFPEGMIGNVTDQHELETDRLITYIILGGIVILLIVVILLALFMRCFHKSQRQRFIRYKQELKAKEPLVQNHNSLNIQYQTPTNLQSKGVQTDLSLDTGLILKHGSKYDEYNDEYVAESQDSTDVRQGILFTH